MPDLIGQSMGRYHILEQLGEGGMATVYKAYDTRLDRDAAVKIIRRDVFPPNQLENILKRFEREAKALARLMHSNIVSVIDYGEEDGTPYLVMPYLPGGTLKQRLGKPIPWQESIRLLLPVGRALQYAHSQKIVHRDVKPSNILITFSGDPMLTDFGIAKILEGAEGQTLTGTGVGVGTPEYMAPEQWTGQSGPLSDIYSLGVVLYEMVTGRKPYVADTPAAVLLKQVNDPLPRPTQFVPDLPDAVEKVLLKALAKQPEDRYPEMGAMVNALENLLAGVSTESQPLLAEKFIPEPSSLMVDETRTAVAQEVSRQVGRDNISSYPSARKIKFLPFGIGAVVVLILISATLGINYIVKHRPAAGVPTSTITPTITSTATLTHIPTGTFIPQPPTATFTATPVIGSTWMRPADGMLMVYVPEGEFTMGSNDGSFDEKPPHTVYLDAFWIDQTEVTNRMYGLCVAAQKCDPPDSYTSYTRNIYYGNSQYDNFPVLRVSWNDAAAYCAWAGGGEFDVRLPTEAEWEKAASWDADKQEKSAYPWGNAIDCTFANYRGKENVCVRDTTKTGNYPSGASFYGALDMAGNVWEWVADWYRADYYSTLQDGVHNPTGPSSGSSRVLRGGSWYYEGYSVRSAYRFMYDPLYSDHNIGFRCSRRVASP